MSSLLPPPSLSPERARRVLRITAAVVFVLLVCVSWAPIELLLEHILYEDFFYYLGVAEHVVRGHGVTFDGSAKTNGFQPLWMSVCVLLQWVANDDLAVRLSLMVGAASHALQALLLHKLLRRLCRSEAVALTAAMFFLLSYRVAAWNLSGLDPPTQGLCLLLAIDRVVAWHDSERRRDLVLLGLVLGLNTWARFDALLFAAFVMLTTMLPLRDWRARLHAPLIAGTVMTVSLLPWFLWSLHQSGVLLPNCQTALAIWSCPDYAFDKAIADNWALLRNQLLQTSWGLGELLTMMGVWPVVFPGPSVAAGLAWLAIALAIGGWLLKESTGSKLAVRRILYVWAMAHASYYAVFTWAEPRYLMPCMLALGIIVTSLVDARLQRRPDERRLAAIVAIVLYLVTVVAGVDAWRNNHGISLWHRYHGDLYRAAMWLRANTPPDAVVGGWNCGIMGYCSRRTVVNLDGVINDEALEPLRQKQLAHYMRERGITWLADSWDEIVKFMDGYSGDPEWRSKWKVEFTSGTIVVGRRVQ